MQQSPLIELQLNGRFVCGLVDTGCTVSLVRDDLVSDCYGGGHVVAFDGQYVNSEDYSHVELSINGQSCSLDAVIVHTLLDGVDVLLGNDVIDSLAVLQYIRAEFRSVIGVGCLFFPVQRMLEVKL